MKRLEKNKKILKNTTFMSIRMMIVMIINLYTVRVVLNALGIEDYGIYNVVVGVITMFSCLSSVLSTATQRFYSYSLGENKFERLQNIFSVSINIYALLSIVIIILGETIGLWFVNNMLVIPIERMTAVNFIYQFSIFSFVLSIMQIPYLSATFAHEDVGIFAVISTSDSVLKLISALLLTIIQLDRLIIYGTFLFLIPALVLITYIIINRSKYPECHYKKPTEYKLYKELLSFSGWTLFGSVAGVGMSQVNTIFINIFFGPLVNASRAIALQIESAITSFCANLLIAIRPPMIKSYAEHDYVFLNKIFYLSNKLIYYCLLMICIPLMFEMDFILNIWLKIVDPQALLFSRIILIYILIMSLNNPISIIIQATGHVKEYHVSVEFFTLLCVPATYILFKLGFPAYFTFVVMIIAAILSHIVRLLCLKKYYKPFSYYEYIKSFIFPAFFITICASFIANLIHVNVLSVPLRLCLIILISILSICILTVFIGLSKSEKEVLKVILNNIKRKSI